jgi:hypothetical protein
MTNRALTLVMKAVVLIAAVAVFATADVHESAARKKIDWLFGCTPRQIQSDDPNVQKCIRQGEDDVRNNRKLVHVLKCTASGYLCCETRGDGFQPSCVWPPDRRRPAIGDRAPTDLPKEPGPTTEKPSARPPVVKPTGRGGG